MITASKRGHGTVCFVRFKLGLTQQLLADALGISRSLVAMFETGKRKLPAQAEAIYLDMCRKAAEVNPYGEISIKRGRKPALPVFSFVTNYAKTPKTDINERFTAYLKHKHDLLRYQLTGLQFRKAAMEKRSKHLSGQLTYVSAILNLCNELLTKLPEGKFRDKYELRAAIFYAKQIKLKQQLQKCGAMALLRLEFQMNLCEGLLGMTSNRNDLSKISGWDRGFAVPFAA